MHVIHSFKDFKFEMMVSDNFLFNDEFNKILMVEFFNTE